MSNVIMIRVWNLSSSTTLFIYFYNLVYNYSISIIMKNYLFLQLISISYQNYIAAIWVWVRCIFLVYCFFNITTVEYFVLLLNVGCHSHINFKLLIKINYLKRLHVHRDVHIVQYTDRAKQVWVCLYIMYI